MVTLVVSVAITLKSGRIVGTGADEGRAHFWPDLERIRPDGGAEPGH